MAKITRGDLDAEFSDTSARRDHPGRKGFELIGKRIAGWLYPNAVDKNDKSISVRREAFKLHQLTAAS